MRFACRTARPFGHVEQKIGLRFTQPFCKITYCLEKNDLAEYTKGVLHRCNGGWIVPLDVCVVVAGGGSLRGVCCWPLIICEPEAHRTPYRSCCCATG